MAESPTARLEDPLHYLERAFEYYLTGRFSALNGLKVAANLLHHAIEMAIKFALLDLVKPEKVDDEAKKLSRRPFGHNLDSLWTSFKNEIKRPDLNRFDTIVSGLHQWEDLRYGGFPRGISTAMLFSRRRGPLSARSQEPQDVYVLVLEDLDELFSEIFRVTNVNPRFLAIRYQHNEALREWHSKENKYPVVLGLGSGGRQRDDLERQ